MIMKVSVVGRLMAIGLGAKYFDIEGGLMAFKVADAEPEAVVFVPA